jgi:hypothetical protein
MYCRQCGLFLQNNICRRCGYKGEPQAASAVSHAGRPVTASTGQTGADHRLWLIFGLLFIFLAVAVMAGSFWFVEKRRATFRMAAPADSPVVSRTTEAESVASSSAPAPALDLSVLGQEDLIKLLPSYALVRLKADNGASKPDSMKVIKDKTDQYLALLASRVIANNRRERMLMVFKVEGNQLVDVTRQDVPQSYPNGRIGDENLKVRFAEESSNIEIASSVWPSNDMVANCADCERAYAVEQLVWEDSSYKPGPKSWNNDPFTACYVAVKALDKRGIDEETRPFITESLDDEIRAGIGDKFDDSWRVERLDSDEQKQGEERSSITYRLSNGVETIVVTVGKNGDQWQAMELARDDRF